MEEFDLVRQHFTGPSPSGLATAHARRRLEQAIEQAAVSSLRIPARRAARWRWRLLLAVAPAATAALVIGAIVIPGARTARPDQATAPTLRAKLTAAMTAASNDVVAIRESSGGPGETNLTWVWPWSPAPGQQVMGQENETGVAGQRIWFSFTMPAQAATARPLAPDAPSRLAASWAVCTSVSWIRVDPAARTWYSFTEGAQHSSRGCLSGAVLPANGSQILSEIKAGNWKAAGHTQIAGQSAIEFTAIYRPVAQSGRRGLPVTVRLWVNSQTYLPIQTDVLIMPGGQQPRPETSTTYAFLPATPGNLALVRPDLSGLTQVAPPY
jgi:hypothetical protein